MKQSLGKYRILLVEDELNFGSVLKDYLVMNGYDVLHCANGREGLEAFRPGAFDLCLLDVMMPYVDGYQVGREIRASDASVPLIYLTAKMMKEDMLEGFRVGADDYITKPFDSEILLLKISALLKRTGTKSKVNEASDFDIGGYRFNPEKRLLEFESEAVTLSPKESELLKLLCLYKNTVLPKNEALSRIWGTDNYFTGRSMDVYIAKLRKYLAKSPTVKITNVHGHGYVLDTGEKGE